MHGTCVSTRYWLMKRNPAGPSQQWASGRSICKELGSLPIKGMSLVLGLVAYLATSNAYLGLNVRFDSSICDLTTSSSINLIIFTSNHRLVLHCRPYGQPRNCSLSPSMSQRAIMPAGQPCRPASAEDWDTRKDIIMELYASKPLKAVMKIMESEHLFKAT